MPSVHCLLNYRHIFRDAHDRINHHRSHAGAHWQNDSFLPWHVPMPFFCTPACFICSAGSYQADGVQSSSICAPHPPSSMPARAGRPGAQSHRQCGGRGQGSMWGAPQGFLVLFACLEPRISMTRANAGIAVLCCRFQTDDRHWKIILTFKTN